VELTAQKSREGGYVDWGEYCWHLGF
jgi:hypothetical protein